MKRCSRCNTNLIQVEKFCHHCGLKVNRKLSFIDQGLSGQQIINELENKIELLEEQMIKYKYENKHARIVINPSHNYGIGFDNNPSARLTITSSGNIGIGEVNPSSHLYVYGNSGNLLFNTTN